MPNETVTLAVRFVGIVTLAVHARLDEVTALLPDATRRRKSADADKAYRQQYDLTYTASHAGYIRFDVESVAPGSPLGTLPGVDLVYRFQPHDIVDFGFPPTLTYRDPAEVNIPLLDMTRFAEKIEPIDGLFDEPLTTPAVLARATLYGGKYKTGTDALPATIAGTLLEQPCAMPERMLPDRIIWERKIPWPNDDAAHVVTIRNDDSGARIEIPLKPVRTADRKRRINVTIANMCNDNPLMWGELAKRQPSEFDLDYKWHYRLYRPKRPAHLSESRRAVWDAMDPIEQWTEILGSALLPAPRFNLDTHTFVDSGDCGENRATLDYPSAAEKATSSETR